MNANAPRSSPRSPFQTAGIFFLVLALVLLGPVFVRAQSYVGSDECAGCHEDIAAGLARTQHGKAAFDKQSSHGCETCHGPGSVHVDDPDIEANRPKISKLDNAELAAMCQGCHDGGKQAFWMGSTHQTRGLACVDCHSVHAFTSVDSQLKQATTMDTCFECHGEVRVQTQKTSHHPIREGKVACGDCHNPHGTTTDSMIAAASTNDLCYECHTEKRGPFVWEHPPVRENCLVCHTPHGSNHAKLQRTAIPYTCQQCHSNTRHPGTLYDASRLFTDPESPGSTSPSNRVFNRSCLNCHANIHGSNHISGPHLGR